MESLFPNYSPHEQLLDNYIHSANDIHSVEGLRDRYTFYWRDTPSKFVGKWEFECKEFRHKASAEDFHVTLFVPPTFRGTRGAVKFRVTAGNMSEPIETVAAITISYEKRSIEDELTTILEKLGA